MELEENIFQEELLYQYTKSRVLLDHILKSNTLKFNLLENTNDPIENQKIQLVSIGSSCETGEEDFEDHFKQQLLLDHNKNRLKIACFTIDNKKIIKESNKPILGKGFAKSRMWSQYGDDHKGVCIIFNKYKIISKIKENKINFKEGNINYSDYNSSLRNASTFKLGTKVDSMNSLKDAYFTKYLDYKDESEFRILIDTCFAGEFFLPIKGCIEAVVIGEKCESAKLQEIKNICESRRINAYSLGWSYSGPYI
jgi:hypothetical protein